MELQIIDIVILIILMIGTFIGFKQGIIKSSVTFLGTIIIVVLAFMFKNPVSEILYTNLPFFNLGEYFSGITLINILIYEAIAFLLLVLIFGFLLKLIVVFTGIVEKILKLTVVLGFVSKILGLIFGFVETFVIVFVGLFLLNNIGNINETIENGVISSKILNNTPILTNLIKEDNQVLNEINELKKKCYNASGEDKNKCNEDSLDIMLKYEVIKPETAQKLVDKKKINIPNASDIIAKYVKKDA